MTLKYYLEPKFDYNEFVCSVSYQITSSPQLLINSNRSHIY